MRRRMMLLSMLACAGAVALGAAPAPAPAAGSNAAAVAAGQRFLARYVLRNGRVIRREQGSDTASAGQAQAMLISVAVGDKPRFARIWGWARSHLQRPDGLLASHWRAGRLANGQPASDADLDAARALLLAARRFAAPADRGAGLRLARAILARETTTIAGIRVLLAGPWGVGRHPAPVNPSYWAPHTFELLAKATGDARFGALEQGALRLASALTSSAPHLPSDWAAVAPSGAITPTSIPGRRATPPEFSFVAARMPIRFAEGCAAASRAVSAAEWSFFGAQPLGRIGDAYGLDGSLLAPQQAAVMLVAAAAAALAAGQGGAGEALFAQAESIDARFPTSYGSAWIALGRLELTTGLLGGC
jgi:endoglucanase